jgi:hypothetical protein
MVADDFIKDGPKVAQPVLSNSWMCVLWDVLNNFGEMEQNSLLQKMVQKLCNPFCQILGWPFFGDVFNNPFWQFRRDGAE